MITDQMNDTSMINITKVKDIVLETLYNDGVITSDQLHEYTTLWQVVVFKNAWYTKWKQVFCSKCEDSGWSIRFLRVEQKKLK